MCNNTFNEADAYNHEAYRNSQIHEARRYAERLTLKIALQHAYYDHGVKVRQLMKRFGLRQNTVLALLKEALTSN